MRLLILRSVPAPFPAGDPYAVRMDTDYAPRVIAHLTNAPGYCGACGDACVSCRAGYNLDFSESIAGILNFPAVLPAILEEPQQLLPDPGMIPPHDVVLAIAVNEEILTALVERLSTTRALVVPIEGSDWISPHAVRTITAICERKSIEIAFPRPFCSFAPEGGMLQQFVRELRIGRPRIEFRLKNGKIEEARVRVSAPCGATYFTARGLAGHGVDENLENLIDKRLSCYPCTAGTAVDPSFRDSITHEATKIQREVLDPIRAAR